MSELARFKRFCEPKQHGLILSLASVDELHAHRDTLGELRRRALELPRVRRQGFCTEAKGQALEWAEMGRIEPSAQDPTHRAEGVGSANLAPSAE